MFPLISLPHSLSEAGGKGHVLRGTGETLGGDGAGGGILGPKVCREQAGTTLKRQRQRLIENRLFPFSLKLFLNVL